MSNDCPNCKKALDAAQHLSGDDRPSDGDLTVCLYCGHLMVFGPNLSLRELTSDEMRDAAGNPEVLKAMMMIKDFNRMH